MVRTPLGSLDVAGMVRLRALASSGYSVDVDVDGLVDPLFIISSILVRTTARCRSRCRQAARRGQAAKLDQIVERLLTSSRESPWRWRAIHQPRIPPAYRRLADGLSRSVDDACDHNAASYSSPPESRRASVAAFIAGDVLNVVAVATGICMVMADR